MILLDTNILLRSKQRNSPYFIEVSEKLLSLVEQDELIIAPQTVYEFYVVATRPVDVNGFGLSTDEAITEVDNLIDTYQLLLETEETFQRWQELVQEFKVEGKAAHDARLVAFMQQHQINKLYTLNQSDFTRYSSVLQLV